MLAAHRFIARSRVSRTVVDTFNRANAASLGTTSDGNATWTYRSGNAATPAGIDGNTAAIPMGVSGDSYYTIPGDTGGILQVTPVLTYPQGDGGGVTWRYQDASNNFLATIGDSGSPLLKVAKIIAGVGTLIFTTTGTTNDVLTVEFDPAGFTVKKNGSVVYAEANTQLNTATDVGVYNANSGGATRQGKIDDFSAVLYH